MRRITMNVTDEQYEALKKRERDTGCTQSEQIRRAIAASLKLERDLADIPAEKPQRAAAIGALLAKEPELAYAFPGYLPEQKSTTQTVLLAAREDAQ
jgi:hypothetical protein